MLRSVNSGFIQINTVGAYHILVSPRNEVLYMFIILLITLTLTDSVIGAYIYTQGFSANYALFVIYIKYIVFFGMFLGYFVSTILKGKVLRHEVYGLLYLLMAIVLSLIIGELYPESAALTRAYTYYFPVIIYFAGAFWGSRKQDALKQVTRKYALCYLIFNGAFALQYYIFGGEYIWRETLQYANFVAEVKGFADGIIEGLPGNFYFDPYGARIPRFVGSMGDPLAAAYAGISLLIALIAIRPKSWALLASVTGVMVLATLTRGVILGALLSFLIYVTFRHRAFIIILVGGTFAAVIAATLSEAIFQFMGDSSTAGHLESINSISSYISITGILFGSLGTGRVPFFEPGLYNIAFTFGIVPTFLFLAFVRGIYVQIGADRLRAKYIALIIIIGLMTLMVISASFLAVTSSWFAWFLFGVYMSSPRIASIRPKPVEANIISKPLSRAVA